MKTSTLVVLFATSLAHAHTIFQKLSVNGQEQRQLFGIRAPNTNNPILNVNDGAMACNNAAYKDSNIITVPAGARVGAWWGHEIGGPAGGGYDPDHPIAASHKGPLIAYLAKVDNAASASSSGQRWFKIHEDGLDSSSKWGVDRLISSGGWHYFDIPQCVAPGNYLLRAEIIALHEGYRQGGAQFYVGCAQINVTGGGSSTGSDTVSFPGGYSASHPGITVNIYGTGGAYDNGGRPYTIPGPSVFKCSANGGGGNNPQPTNTGSQPQPTGGNGGGSGSVPLYGQCGGQGYTGPTGCAQGTCTASNQWYTVWETPFPTTLALDDGDSDNEGLSEPNAEAVSPIFSNIKMRLGDARNYTSTDAELAALYLAMVKAVHSTEQSIAIYTDSKRAINRLCTRKPQHGQVWIDNIIALANSTGQRKTYKIRWIKGHDESQGNHEADTRAKEAAKGEGLSPNQNVSRDWEEKILKPETYGLSTLAMKNRYDDELTIFRDIEWRASFRWPRFQQIDPQYPPKLFYRAASKLSRSDLCKISQLRTGTLPLKAYLFQIKKEESPKCRLCDAEEDETTYHVFFKCEAHREARESLVARLGRNPKSIAHILETENGYYEALRFMRKTNRPEHIKTIREQAETLLADATESRREAQTSITQYFRRIEGNSNDGSRSMDGVENRASARGPSGSDR